MTDFNAPEHVLDFRNTLNCATIESLKPSQETTVLVYLANDASRKSVRAIGRRSTDGTTFEVSVPTPNGNESHTWAWWILESAIQVHRGK